jgi:Skp family chaperone for outer membrane proteins
MRAKYVLLSLLPCVVCAYAQADVRIATVDVARILNDSPEAVSKKKELDALSDETRKKLESKAKELQGLKSKLENAKVSGDSKEAESFRNQARDFERMRGQILRKSL